MKARHTYALFTAVILAGCNSGNVNLTNHGHAPLPNGNVVTVDYQLSGFDKVSLGASFDYSIQQGNSFSVEVTIDSSYTDDLDVRVDGDTLEVGFNPNSNIRSNVMETVITLPTIMGIDISGSADGIVAGFDGNTLEIDVSGSARLEASNLRFDYLWITNDGSARLNLSGVAAIAAGDVQLDGSSVTTLNLMDFATLTGQISGSSALNYYGSNVNLQIATSQTASITRLGESR